MFRIAAVGLTGAKRVMAFSARLLASDEAALLAPFGALPHGSLSHQPAFVSALGGGRWVGVFEGGTVCAVAPFIVRSRRGIVRWRNPAPAPFGGLLTLAAQPSESLWRDCLAALAAEMPGLANGAELILAPGRIDARALCWAGWEAAPHYNYAHRIEGADALSRAAEDSVRRQARKAAAAGCVLKHGLAGLDAILAIWGETRARQGLPDYVPDATWRAIAGLPGASVVWVESGSGRVEAGAIFAGAGERVSYLLGASRSHGEGESGSGAPSLLHLEAARFHFEQRGAFTLDWCGANTASVAQFKKKFRPTLELTIRATWRTGLQRLMRF